jgi:hypothetical protein
MKRLTLLFAVILLPVAGFAQSGTTGNLTWSISDGTLTVSGTGAMPSYYYSTAANNIPWYSSRANINKIVINNGVTSIGWYAFRDCGSLTAVSIPNSVAVIEGYAFSGCSSLTTVSIPNSVTVIEGYAFQNCSSLTTVTVPNSVTIIGGYAFQNCRSLTAVTVPNGVTSIGDLAFYGCVGLISISIPNSVTGIGDLVFQNCSNLTAVEAGWNLPPPLARVVAAFYGVNVGNCTLFVPPGSKALYETAAFWRDFGKIVEKERKINNL